MSLYFKVVGSSLPILPIPTNLAPNLSFVLRPAEVLGLSNLPIEEGGSKVLIFWEHSSPIDATWEAFSVVKDKFPYFHLEDKVALWGRVMIGPRSLRFVLGEMQE